MDEVLAFQTTTGVVSSRYYPHANHLYSVAALTNAAGQVVERYTYDAYGKQTITSATGVVRTKSAVGWDRGFTGYVTDNETGLMYARSRMYSPTLGRFVGRDQVYIDGQNLYCAYFIPNHVDWSGRDISTNYYPMSPVGMDWEWYDGPEKEAARLERSISVKCKCIDCCDEYGKKGYKVKCTISMKFRIKINKNGNNSGTSSLRNGVYIDFEVPQSYGHEQLHIKNIMDYMNGYLKIISPLTDACIGRCSASYWESDITERFGFAEGIEAGHLNPHPTPTGGYNPMGGVFPPASN